MRKVFISSTTEDLEKYLLTLGFAEHSDHINTEHAEVHAALAIAEALREQTKAFSALSMHGQRLSRQFERTLQQLRELQAERRAAEQTQLHKNKQLTFDPSEPGFVFSNKLKWSAAKHPNDASPQPPTPRPQEEAAA